MTNVYPLVTIAIPTYNRAGAYLREAIKSALDQTYSNLEIIVSDNCSIDDTESVVKSFSDRRIRYVRHGKNIGANNNFNFCLQKAAGSYFLLLHDDDLIDGDFVSTCIKAANQHDSVGVIRTGTRSIDSAGNVILENENLAGGLSLTDFLLAWLSGKTPMYLCSTLFNTAQLKKIGGFKSKHNLYQDVIAQVTLAARCGRIDVKNIKASFRNHPMQNTNSVKIGAWCEDSLILLDIMCGLAPNSKKMLEHTGFQYFLKRNFMMASRIQSPVQKYMAYMVVFKAFNYPIKFFTERLRLKFDQFKDAVFS